MRMNDKTKKTLHIILPLAILVGLIVLVLCRPKSEPVEKQTVVLGIATWPGFASAMVGKEMGFFDGIEVQYRTIDDLSARHAAFRSGQVDIMASSVDLWVQEYSQGLKGKIMLVTDESAGGDGIVAKPEIKTVADLRGKKVAFARATPSHYLLFKALAKANLKPDDIEQIKMEDPGLAGQAFLGGQVDVAVTWEPFLTQVKESTKGHVLATSKDFPETIVDVLVASPKLLEKQGVVKRFVQGWLKSVDYIKSHPDEAAQIIAKGLNVKKEDAEGMMAGLQFAETERNRYFFTTPQSQGSSPLDNVIRDAGGFWKQQNITSEVPAPSDIRSNFLQDAPTTASGK